MLFLVVVLLGMLALPPRASAVHLFLDSNRDGTHTSVDVVNERGATRATLHLLMDTFKEGTHEECSHGRRPGDHAYAVVLRVTGGTVTWELPDSRARPAGPIPWASNIRYEHDDSTYVVVRGTIVDRGGFDEILLGDIGLTIRRGRPSVAIVRQCPAHETHTTRLSMGTWDGEVWQCADGLPYGGQANRAPSLMKLADDVPIRPGTVERLQFVATDADGDPLTFRLASGPTFAMVRTLDLGGRTERGEIEFSPDSCASGQGAAVIEVTDGFATDSDTMSYMVKGIRKPAPSPPMQVSAPGSPGPDSRERSLVEPSWLVGEWELHEGWGGKGSRFRPVEIGSRWRWIFRPDGTMHLFVIASGRITWAHSGTYRIDASSQLRVSSWFEPFYRGGPFRIGRGASSFTVSPAGFSHASTHTFVRVPPVFPPGSRDTLRMVLPLPEPSVRWKGRDTEAMLPHPMRRALQELDRNFHVWRQAHARALGSHTIRGPSAITGDFDGDLLVDIALLGRNGADQSIVVLLSDHGRVRAEEVAWRRVVPGRSAGRSRGDPQGYRPVFLELAARGSRNPFCWVERWRPIPRDGVGVVDEDGTRFDYVRTDSGFTLFAPLP